MSRYLCFLQSFPSQTPKSMRKPMPFVLLPVSCSLVCRLSCSPACLQPQLLHGRQSPALHGGAGWALVFSSLHGFLAKFFTEQPQRTWCAFFLSWVISKDPNHPRHRQNSKVQGLSNFRPLTKLVLTWGPAWETPNTGLCVRNKHSHTRSYRLPVHL